MRAASLTFCGRGWRVLPTAAACWLAELEMEPCMGSQDTEKGANFKCKVCGGWHGGYPKTDVCGNCLKKGLG